MTPGARGKDQHDFWGRGGSFGLLRILLALPDAGVAEGQEEGGGGMGVGMSLSETGVSFS